MIWTLGTQYLSCEKELRLNRDIVNGSGIALGHPVGAIGCRLVVTLIHEMAKKDLAMGLATLCVWGRDGLRNIGGERIKADHTVCCGA